MNAVNTEAFYTTDRRRSSSITSIHEVLHCAKFKKPFNRIQLDLGISHGWLSLRSNLINNYVVTMDHSLWAIVVYRCVSLQRLPSGWAISILDCGDCRYCMAHNIWENYRINYSIIIHVIGSITVSNIRQVILNQSLVRYASK